MQGGVYGRQILLVKSRYFTCRVRVASVATDCKFEQDHGRFRSEAARI
jgi:hypothetical protein